MGSLKSIILAGAAACASIPAFAADLAPPYMPRPAIVAPPAEEFSGWYLRGDVGVGAQEFSDFAHNQTNSAFVWPASWRIEQKRIQDTAFVGAGAGFARHNVTTLTDVGFISDGSTGFGFASTDASDFKFAWAVHAGLAYNVSNNLKLELAYRYLNMGDVSSAVIGCNSTGCATTGPRAFYTLTDFHSHDFKLGMRWLFNEPAAPPPPLVRKG